MGKGKRIGAGSRRNGVEGVVIITTSISTQIPNQKAAKKKLKINEISREQHSKQANIRQEKL